MVFLWIALPINQNYFLFGFFKNFFIAFNSILKDLTKYYVNIFVMIFQNVFLSQT